MPRGENEAFKNAQGYFGKVSKEELRKIASKGGSRRQMGIYELQAELEDELSEDDPQGQSKGRKIVKRLAYDAYKGNIKAAKLMVDILGFGKNKTKMEVTGADGTPLFSSMTKEQAQKIINDIDGQVVDNDKGEM